MSRAPREITPDHAAMLRTRPRKVIVALIVTAFLAMGQSPPAPSVSLSAAAQPPAEIVGQWYNGNVSSGGYADPITGSWTAGSGQGMMFTFHPDGRWEYGYLMGSALFDCRMRVLVYRAGVLASVDLAAHTATLDAQTANVTSEDNCLQDNNYVRELPADDETIIWERSTDEFGDVLLLRGPATEFSTFRPVAP
jgi:hypothetical protein